MKNIQTMINAIRCTLYARQERGQSTRSCCSLGTVPGREAIDASRITHHASRQKGAALILVLFTMIFVALLVVAFLDTFTIEEQINTNQIRALQAVSIADAGIDRAVYELRQDSGYSGTGGDITFPSGSGNTYNVSIAGSTITSVGTVSDFTRTIEADFALGGSSSPYTVTINTWEELT